MWTMKQYYIPHNIYEAILWVYETFFEKNFKGGPYSKLEELVKNESGNPKNRY